MKKKMIIIASVVAACGAIAGFLYSRHKTYLDCLRDLDDPDDYEFYEDEEDELA